MKRLDPRARLLERQQAFIKEKEGKMPVISLDADELLDEKMPGEMDDSLDDLDSNIQKELDAGKEQGKTIQKAKKTKTQKTESATERFMDLIRREKKYEDSQEREKESDEIDQDSAYGEKTDTTKESEDIKEETKEKQVVEEQVKEPEEVFEPYVIPSIEIMRNPPKEENLPSHDKLLESSKILETKLADFGIEGKIVSINPGPVITQYEVELAPGIRVNRVEVLSDDLAMAMAAVRIRIVAPIPGKNTIGIEVPNKDPAMVYFKDVAREKEFLSQTPYEIKLVLGKTITGSNQIMDITRMPHQLIGGQTGSGKSICINSFLCSVLLTKSPDEVKFILIDPKVVELQEYNGIPHLISPVVSEPREAIRALKWTCGEMDKRYRLLARAGVRNIAGFNKRFEEGQLNGSGLDTTENKRLPYILIVIDELADLMSTASKEVEMHIGRIAQLSRAVGIHLILATQSPRTTIITGAIKANLTSRIAFQVAQMNDSRTILDRPGAEKLLGRGDMLFLPSGSPEAVRIHGTYISDEDIKVVLEAVKKQHVKKELLSDFLFVEEEEDGGILSEDREISEDNASSDEELLKEAAYIVVRHQLGSTSLLQRRLKIGYARAGRLMDGLEELGIVGPNVGSKAREVLIESEQMVDAIFENLYK